MFVAKLCFKPSYLCRFRQNVRLWPSGQRSLWKGQFERSKRRSRKEVVISVLETGVGTARHIVHFSGQLQSILVIGQNILVIDAENDAENWNVMLMTETSVVMTSISTKCFDYWSNILVIDVENSDIMPMTKTSAAIQCVDSIQGGMGVVVWLNISSHRWFTRGALALPPSGRAWRGARPMHRRSHGEMWWFGSRHPV